MLVVDQAMHRQRPQIRDMEIVAGLERFGGRRRDAVAEAADTAEMAEEDGFGRGAKRAGLPAS
ncbi:MAG: hypothetical protein WDN48_09605 [Pseudolabrys sp.]